MRPLRQRERERDRESQGRSERMKGDNYVGPASRKAAIKLSGVPQMPKPPTHLFELRGSSEEKRELTMLNQRGCLGRHL